MKTKRSKVMVFLLMVVFCASIFAGFSKVQNSASKYGPPKYNKTKVLQMEGSWSKPPAFHTNFYNADFSYSLGDILYERLFTIIRVGTGKIYYQLAQSVENKGNKTIVHLRKGVKWHDGVPFTSKDIWAYYMIRNSAEVLKYCSNVETPDSNTFVFIWSKPVFTEMKMRLIAKDLNGTVPYHIFKKFVDQTAALLHSGKKPKEIKNAGAFGLELPANIKKMKNKTYSQFLNFGPKTPLGTGPYKFQSVDDNQMLCVKNPDYYDAKNVNFEKIRFIIPGADIAQSNAMLMNGDIDVTFGTPPKDMLDTIMAGNSDLIQYKMFDNASYGLVFNNKKKPFNDVRVRKAITYMIDKKKVREIVQYYGKEFPEISGIGCPPTMYKNLLLKDTKLTNFTQNNAKATALLKEAGWSKGSNGKWLDSTGKSPEFLICADAGWDMTINSAQIVSEQLQKFGLDVKVKAIDGSVFWTAADEGQYDMYVYLTDMCWNMNEPWDALKNAFDSSLAYSVGQLPNKSKGEVFRMPGRNGKMVDVFNVIAQYPVTQSSTERQKMLNDLMYIYNENCYSVNLFQTAYGVFLNGKTIAGNFPMGDAAIKKYKGNMPYATNTADNDAIVELNFGFQSNRLLVNGNFWPR